MISARVRRSGEAAGMILKSGMAAVDELGAWVPVSSDGDEADIVSGRANRFTVRSRARPARWETGPA